MFGKFRDENRRKYCCCYVDSLKKLYCMCCLNMNERQKMRGYWRGLVVNDVFTYWWLIMSYQELIACTVASLSTAWRPATGQWLHTSLRSLLFQYVPCSFSCHVLHLCSFYCVIVGAIFLRIIKGLGDLKVQFMDFISCCGNCSDSLILSTFLFTRPVNSSLFLWHFSLPAPSSFFYFFFCIFSLFICLFPAL